MGELAGSERARVVKLIGRRASGLAKLLVFYGRSLVEMPRVDSLLSSPRSSRRRRIKKIHSPQICLLSKARLDAFAVEGITGRRNATRPDIGTTVQHLRQQRYMLNTNTYKTTPALAPPAYPQVYVPGPCG